jgi:aminoglycoside 2'-N-acetyltransferase I
MESAGVRVRRCHTGELAPAAIEAIRAILRAAFAPDGEGFTDEDWAHSVGGAHFVAELDGEIVTHASVVERVLHTGGHDLGTGYVEAVATDPRHEGRGFGSSVMRAANAHILESYELGGLSTGVPGFYERLGWRRWIGPTFVLTEQGPVPTPDDDGGILYLPTPRSPALDPSLPIGCDWRAGDVW